MIGRFDGWFGIGPFELPWQRVYERVCFCCISQCLLCRLQWRCGWQFCALWVIFLNHSLLQVSEIRYGSNISKSTRRNVCSLEMQISTSILPSSFGIAGASPLRIYAKPKWETIDIQLTFNPVTVKISVICGNVFVRFQPVGSDFREGHCTAKKNEILFHFCHYGLEACPCRKSRFSSLNFATNGTFSKFFFYTLGRRNVWIFVFKCLN